MLSPRCSQKSSSKVRSIKLSGLKVRNLNHTRSQRNTFEDKAEIRTLEPQDKFSSASPQHTDEGPVAASMSSKVMSSGATAIEQTEGTKVRAGNLNEHNWLQQDAR